MSAYQPLLLVPGITSGELRVEARTARLFHGMLGYLSSGSLTCRHSPDVPTVHERWRDLLRLSSLRHATRV